MKNTTFLLVLVSNFFLASYSFGAPPPGASPTPTPVPLSPTFSLKKHGVPLSCRGIEHACKHATPPTATPATGPDIVADCMIPVLNGKIIKGVNVPKSVVKVCKDAVDGLVEADKAHMHKAATAKPTH